MVPALEISAARTGKIYKESESFFTVIKGQINMVKIGLIAGQGDLPKEVISKCLEINNPIYVLAYDSQTDPTILTNVPHDWIKLGQVGKAIDLLKKNNVTKIILAGKIDRPASLGSLMPDLKGAALFTKLLKKQSGDDTLFRIIVDFLENEGFQILSADDILGQESLFPSGVLGKHSPDKQGQKDITRGIEVAKALGLVDVGQAVIVQNGVTLGVEAVEGTDALIERTKDYKLDEPGGILIKILKPHQETRVDRSVIGPQTIRQAAKAGLRGIAAQENAVMFLNKNDAVKLADDLGLFLIGVPVE